MAIAILVLGLLLFLGAHSVSIVKPGLRGQFIGQFGQNAWQGAFGLVALSGFLLILWGYGLARQDPIILYTPPTWLRHINLLLMLGVFPLLLATYFPGRIQSAVGHPTLLAVKLWAFGHLLANGALADLLLFGGFLAWAIADRLSLRYRTALPVQGAPP